LYPATLLYLFMVSKSFWVEFFAYLRYRIILSANKNILTVSLPISFLLFLLFAYLLCLEIPGLCGIGVGTGGILSHS
jgi:hypothetical protein